MYVQSALAIKRQREKRANNEQGVHAPLPVIPRSYLKPPDQKSNLTYFNVGASFIIIGSFLVLTSVIPDDFLGPDWTSLIPIGILFVIIGIIMVTINQIQTKREEKQLENYVKTRLGKSTSGNPLVFSDSRDLEGVCENNEEMVAIMVPEDDNHKQQKTSSKSKSSKKTKKDLPKRQTSKSDAT